MAKRPEALIFGKTLYNRKEALQSCGISREAAKPFLIIPIGGNERLLGFQPVFIPAPSFAAAALDKSRELRFSQLSQISIPFRWSISCWMIWAVQPEKRWRCFFQLSSTYSTSIF